MTTTTLPTPEAAAWLASHTQAQRDLALRLDGIVSSHWFTTCMTGEADLSWELLVGHASGRDIAPDPVDARAIEDALTAVRTLGGTWGGDGCLHLAGEPFGSDGEQEFCPEAMATWYTLEEMADRAGKALPERNLTAAEYAAALACESGPQRPRPRRTTRRQRRK